MISLIHLPKLGEGRIAFMAWVGPDLISGPSNEPAPTVLDSQLVAFEADSFVIAAAHVQLFAQERGLVVDTLRAFESVRLRDSSFPLSKG